MWVRPWLLQREERGADHNIMAELYAKTKLKPRLARQAANYRAPNQCWREVSPHPQISGHWRVLHIIILSVQGWQIHHLQVSRGLQGHPG